MDYAKSKWPRLTFALLLLLTTPGLAGTPRLSIIIDDIGQDRAVGQRAIALPFPAAIAVLPFLPASRELARAAHENGKEVLLHQPMENLARTSLGPGGLTLTMAHTEVIAALSSAIDSVPHCVGVSNHTGSLLTQEPLQMGWVMSELDRRGLYFIDSRTTHHTVALTAAELEAVPVLRRHIFLDNQRTKQYLADALERAIEHASRHGYAVIIAHPYDVTLTFLESQVHELNGIEIVPPSTLLLNPGVRELVRRGERERLLEEFRWGHAVPEGKAEE